MNKINIHTVSLGCPKNLVDTEIMLGAMGEAFRAVDRPEQAQAVLINTCGFIQPAVEESLQVILETAAAISGLRPKPLLVVTGCLVARYGHDLRAELPEVDLWLTLKEQAGWVTQLKDRLGLEEVPSSHGRRLSTPPGTAYLKIAEGCNHRCSFCTIPSLRGRLRSRPVSELRREALDLIGQGVSELVLVAQDVTAYGRDLDKGQDLKSLVGTLLDLPDLKWLRLLYLYPAGLTPGLLRFLAGCGPAFLPYFDIPVQHAHPDILASMGRPFARDPLRLMDRVRDHFPGAAMRTSLIVGYPGETARHFKALLAFVQKVRFRNLGVFTYHPEKGTRAAGMPGQVPAAVKRRRQEEIMAVQAAISAEVLAGEVGKTLDVLVDRPDPEWPTLFQGRVWFQAPEVDGITYLSGQGLSPGRMVAARIEESKTYDLVAVPENEG